MNLRAIAAGDRHQGRHWVRHLVVTCPPLGRHVTGAGSPRMNQVLRVQEQVSAPAANRRIPGARVTCVVEPGCSCFEDGFRAARAPARMSRRCPASI